MKLPSARTTFPIKARRRAQPVHPLTLRCLHSSSSFQESRRAFTSSPHTPAKPVPVPPSMSRSPQFPPNTSSPRLNTLPPQRPDHATRTAHEVRQDAVFSAEIVDSAPANASGTVKTFLFQIDPFPPSSPSSEFTFLPGQWLDVFIHSVPVIGGFSLTSAPSLALREGKFELAIKKSGHPPAAWFHAPGEERRGVKVDVRVGGGFTYPPTARRGEEVPDHDEIVFISGGVGLNTTLSILRSLADPLPSPARLPPSPPPRSPTPAAPSTSSTTTTTTPHKPKTTLLYSSKPQELLFLPHLPSLIPPSNVTLFLTGSSDPHSPEPLPPGAEVFEKRRWRRMEKDDVRGVVEDERGATNGEGKGRGAGKLYYVCGPPAMTDSIVSWLKHDFSVPRDRVLLEKWW